ncbi:hypothetical protein BGZ65_003972 [Modicella reniformis]|uniref:Nudix hydrolase domain-containing protein n=1 Tax=Modicella reniformis TaxID=1440133 RepID=A0A9P6IND6_9FUNG|nr:hypothetical protein BGZ65_003972 [Modicella reniformis]
MISSQLDQSQESRLRIRKIFTLIFIHDRDHEQLLLGQKQRGPLVGQWNGFGGKVEKALETVAESAARELQEEAFLSAPLFPIGFIQWVVSSPEEPTYRDIMVVYKAHSYELVPPPTVPVIESLSAAAAAAAAAEKTSQRIEKFNPSDEMAPAWWNIDLLPWYAMRINHKIWYPHMLANRPYAGVYWYQMSRSIAPEGAHNAHRETAQEIWIEDLGKRHFEYGTRPVGGNNNHDHDDHDNDDDATLTKFVRRIDVSEDGYNTRISNNREEMSGGGYQVEKQHMMDPTPNHAIDEQWLLAAIAKAEQEWVS